MKPDGWERGNKSRAAKGNDEARGGDEGATKKKKKSFGLEEAEAVTLARAATTATGEPVKDDYDKLTRELGLEARGQATDKAQADKAAVVAATLVAAACCPSPPSIASSARRSVIGMCAGRATTPRRASLGGSPHASGGSGWSKRPALSETVTSASPSACAR